MGKSIYKLVLVDGRQCLFRCLAAEIAKESPEAQAFVFMRLLSTIKRRFQGARMIVTWEGGHSPWRKALHPGYKVRPKEPDPEMARMLRAMHTAQPLFEEMLSKLGIPQARLKGWEGDDVLAFFALTLPGPTIMVSSDNDFFSLLREEKARTIHQIRPGEENIIDPAAHVANHGVPPYLWPLYKACMGDKSDEIPGIAGVGKKTAALICQAMEPIVPPHLATHEVLLQAAYTVCSGEGANGKMRKLCDALPVVELNLKLMDLQYAVERMSNDERKHLLETIAATPRADSDDIRQWLMDHRMVSIVAEYFKWVGPFLNLTPVGT